LNPFILVAFVERQVRCEKVEYCGVVCDMMMSEVTKNPQMPSENLTCLCNFRAFSGWRLSVLHVSLRFVYHSTYILL
jgi:hypothetical protein